MKLLTFTLIIILTIYAALGTQMHFEADDYCHATDAREYGVLGNVVHVWLTWNGRYAQNTVSPTLYLMLGERVPQVLPALMLVVLVGVAYLVTRRWVIALSLTYALIAGLQNIWQVLYWTPASITYLLPLTCLGVLVYSLWHLSPPDSMKALRWLP